MAETYKPSKRALEIVRTSRQAEYKNDYFALQDGTLDPKYVDRIVAILAKTDAEILEEMRIRKAIEDMILNGVLKSATLINLAHQYDPDQTPRYVAPGLELQMNRRNAPDLIAVYESRVIRPVRSIHEGLWGIEVTGDPSARPNHMMFVRMQEPEGRLESVITQTAPRIVEEPRSPTLFERGKRLLAGK